jgi:hypothetical protein
MACTPSAREEIAYRITITFPRIPATRLDFLAHSGDLEGDDAASIYGAKPRKQAPKLLI